MHLQQNVEFFPRQTVVLLYFSSHLFLIDVVGEPKPNLTENLEVYKPKSDDPRSADVFSLLKSSCALPLDGEA